MRSSSVIDMEKTQLEKDLKVAIGKKSVVEVAMHELSREILVLQVKKKDLSISLTKARMNVRVLEVDISLKTSEFFSTKNEGL